MKSDRTGYEYLKSLTVLYVEDDKDTHDQLCYFLSKTVTSFYSAKDGAEGLRLFQEKKPDIVITDLQMPIMNGLELAIEIRKVNKFIPIIMLTAHEQLNYLRDSINIGINKYIVKPIVGDTFINTLLECSEDLSAIRTLQQSSRIDSLTGLSNRWGIDNRFEIEKSTSERHNTPFSILIADIDHFKKVNDTYGHLAGDFVLKKTAEALKSALRTEDFCGRWGGEEFVILLPRIGLVSASNVAEKLRSTISQLEIFWQDKIIHTTISLGVGIFKPGMLICECLDTTDKALYKAKISGRNRYEIAENIAGSPQSFVPDSAFQLKTVQLSA